MEVIIRQPKKEPKYNRSPALIEAQKRYYEKHKDHIVEQQTKYNETYNSTIFSCICGCKVLNSSVYHHIRSTKHLVRMNNIAEGRLAGSKMADTRHNCECGSVYVYKNAEQHFRTQKHKNYMKNNIKLKVI
tara:strand:+ start:755 stop:1147 length:393 start_codon:yes stop_codon:yes gene_type:complete